MIMNDSFSSAGKFVRWSAAFLLLALLLPAFSVPSVSAADDAPTSALIADGGFELPRPEGFRDMYGRGLSAGLLFRTPLSGPFSIGGRTGFVHWGAEIRDLKFWGLTAAPMVFREMGTAGNLRLSIGAGPGIAHRRASLIVHTYNQDLWYNWYTLKDNAWDVFLTGALLGDLPLGKGWLIGGHLYYDYIFGDPKHGDFGDTGGLHLTLAVGREW